MRVMLDHLEIKKVLEEYMGTRLGGEWRVCLDSKSQHGLISAEGSLKPKQADLPDRKESEKVSEPLDTTVQSE